MRGGSAEGWLKGYALLALAVLYAPILFLLLFSFNDSTSIAFPIRTLTLKWYAVLAENDRLLDALLASLKVAIAASLAATFLAILAAKAATRYRLPGRGALIAVILSPMVVPEVVLATALLGFMLGIGLSPSLLNVALGHVLVAAPFAFAVLTSRFEGFDPSLEEASLDLGETGFGTFWRVTLPLIMPGVISSLLLCFLISFDEFLMAFFLSGTEPTLPVYMFSQLRFPQKLPSVLSLAAIIIIASIGLIVLAEWLRRDRRGVEA
jgi:spermidine/putrescine transport system permease protein